MCPEPLMGHKGMDMQIIDCTAVELSERIKHGEWKVSDAVDAVFTRIAQTKELNCYITLLREEALKSAEKVQKGIDAGELTGPLAGVPFAVKDNLCTKGIRTTCGSKMLENFVPAYSAEAVQKIEEAGGVLIGKTNLDEFAMGSTTETSYFGAAKNPANTFYSAGGSSGGSAAAVAAGASFAALGSDTGGSVRQPASHCGVVGMKPTYGSVSRYGLIAHASSLDQIGPVTKDVRDCAAVLQTICTYDSKDSTSMRRQDTDFMSALVEDVKGMRIGVPANYFDGVISKEVKEAVLSAADVLREQGAIVEWFDLPLTEYAVPAYYTISSAEASSNLERYDGIRYGYRSPDGKDLHGLYKSSRSQGFGAEVKRRIMLGTFVLSAGYYEAYYLQALKTKRLIKNAFDEAFAKYDVILGPVSPDTAPRLGSSLDNPLQMYPSDVYTVAANLAGLPAISVPCGRDTKGLPIGVQFMADCLKEKTLLQVAYTYEQERMRYV